MEHRKRVRHIEDFPAVHELTFSCYQRWPLLNDDSRRKLLADAISAATANYHVRLLAFVFMPEHVHLLVLPTLSGPCISALLKAIKRPTSYRIKQSLHNNQKLVEQLTVHQRPGVTTFRFWQEGPGYDRNLGSIKAIESAIDYIHCNPVRRKLCQRAIEWKWSSARFFQDPTAALDPDLPRLDPMPYDLLQ
jgi:putative transposase